ncbi:MSHA biogenesis protein MshL [gamma proteobacterium IMCC2047]|nr:MSHA biogenesis protein MshL [gamma proteobacterium IMCC2047]
MRTRIFKIDYLNVQRMGSSETQVSSGQVSSAGSSDSSSGSSDNNRDNDDDNDNSDNQTVVGTRLKTNTDADFWAGLSETISIIIGAGENRRVVVSPQSGMVIVHALASELRAVAEFLDKAELSLRRQVILEAKILEVELSDGFQAGVNWSALAEVGQDKNVIFGTGLTNSVRTINPVTGDTTLTNTILGTPTATTATSDSVGGVFSAALNLKDFNALIDLLSTQGSVQVLSSPRISTVNNQKAVIKVGTDEFFVTEISSETTTNTSSTTSTDVELTPFFSGIALDVTPQISEEGEVVLHIHPTVSEVTDQTKTVVGPNGDLVLPLALSSIRETDSIVRARNGQVVVIGGLMQNSSTDNNAKTPFLGDLPLLGNAFRQKRQSSVKSELVILLKPIIADDDAWRSSIEGSQRRILEFQQGL